MLFIFQPATEKQRKKLLLKVSSLAPKWSQKPWLALYDMRKLFKNGLDEPMVSANYCDRTTIFNACHCYVYNY